MKKLFVIGLLAVTVQAHAICTGSSEDFWECERQETYQNKILSQQEEQIRIQKQILDEQQRQANSANMGY